jgi:hypothetical protein
VQYGVKIFVMTSFKDTCYIEIQPKVQKSNKGMQLIPAVLKGRRTKTVVMLLKVDYFLVCETLQTHRGCRCRRRGDGGRSHSTTTTIDGGWQRRALTIL